MLDLFDPVRRKRVRPGPATGKPNPLIFWLAAEELRLQPSACVVVEDASVGIRAAKAGGMAALSLARLGDEAAGGGR